MSDTTESLRRKTGSAEDLQSVVCTMKALAASTIGQYEKSVRALGDYHRTVELGLGVCFREDGAAALMAERKGKAGAMGAVVFGSDQGLVGQFNDVIADYAVRTLAALPGKPQIWSVGERAYARLADSGLPVAGLFPVPNSVQAITPLVGEILVKSVARHGEVAELHLFYNRPTSGAVYEPIHQQLLPLDETWRRELAERPWPTKNLPEIVGDGMTTLRALIREYLFVSLFRACAESLASENASRLAAMERADENIDDLLKSLHATFRRLRQSGIDEELFDVIAGFEALGGEAKAPPALTVAAPLKSPSPVHHGGTGKEGEKIMKNNPLKQLGTLGQSIWLDYIRRDLIAGGKLRRMITEDGLRGMTSNPSIFEKAIADSHDYDEDILAMAGQGKGAAAIYEIISQCDVQSAAGEFRALYDSTDGQDGYVSLEVNPHLAHDTNGTLEEARRLWAALNRPNVFIKVPATAEGLPAIQQLIGEGISINVTLLFGLPRYRQVAEAYVAGIEARAAQGKPVQHVASVASFFVSRIDALMDPQLEKMVAQGGKQADLAATMRGQVAIASAKMAYQIYQEIFGGDRFKRLADQGARVQRLLWASTGTKNPEYSDVKYVEALIGQDTVNTAPLETLDAYRDHGQPESRLEKDVIDAARVLKNLPELGIDLDTVTQHLEDEGVEKFNQPFDKLMATLAQRSTQQK